MKSRRKIFIGDINDAIKDKSIINNAMQILIDVILKKSCEMEEDQRIPHSFKKMFGTQQTPEEIENNDFDWDKTVWESAGSLVGREKILIDAINAGDDHILVAETNNIKDSIVADINNICCVDIKKEC